MGPAYQALRETAAWIDLSGRGKIRMTGEDRARLLHAMCTQSVETMQPGEGGYAFFLNPQGRILADANIFCFKDHFLIDTEPETAHKLYEHMDHYIIADDVALSDETESTATLAVEGPQSGQALRELGASAPEKDYATTLWDKAIVAKVNSTGAEGFFIFGRADTKNEIVAKLGALPQAGAAEARVVRIENGRPRYGEEISERYLVQETAQMRGVHLNKGCYLGQEIVERVRSRGQVHRVLRRLVLDTKELPAAGTKLAVGAETAAEIASSVFSPALGKVAALAYVRTQFAEPGTVIDAGALQARVS